MQWQSNLALLYPVADLGVGPGGPGPPVFLDQTEASERLKKICLEAAPPISGSGCPPPLSEGLDPPLVPRYNGQPYNMDSS